VRMNPTTKMTADIFQTEGVRYAGSKRALLPFIHQAIQSLPIQSVLDGFSGSSRVSQFFKKAGYTVHSNDIAIYSSVFATTYLLNNEPSPETLEKIEHLNNLPPQDGFYTETYSGLDDGAGKVVAADGKKKPFQLHNTRKIDAIRPEIDRVAKDEVERCTLLTSLCLALDKVENTLGHQVAYLSKWAPRTYQELQLKLPKLIVGHKAHQVSQKDAKTIKSCYDLAYFDPPYNTNNTNTATTRVRYASYYHFWTTLVKNDAPEVIGASNRRKDCSSDRIPGAISPFEHTSLHVVERELEQLIQAVRAQFVLCSYSNKGKISPERFTDILSGYGELLSITPINHKENIQKSLRTTNLWPGDPSPNIEYLFLLKK